MNFYMLHMCANSYEQCQNHQKSSCTCLHVNNCFFDGFDRATARDREGAKRHRGTQVLLIYYCIFNSRAFPLAMIKVR